MIYLVSYDLNRQKDYSRLIGRIREYSAHARILYSQWLVEATGSSYDVANDLIKYMDADDAILVSEMTNQVSWRNLMINDETMNKWVAAARRC